MKTLKIILTTFILLLTALMCIGQTTNEWTWQYSAVVEKPFVFYNVPRPHPITNDLVDEWVTTDGFAFSLGVSKFIDNKYYDDEWAYHVSGRLGYEAWYNFQELSVIRSNTIGAGFGINNEYNIFATANVDYAWQKRRFFTYVELKFILNDDFGNLFNKGSKVRKIVKGTRMGFLLQGGIIPERSFDVLNNNPYFSVGISLEHQRTNLRKALP